MKMRRFAAAILSVLMFSACVTGCGSTEETPAATDGTASTESTSDTNAGGEDDGKLKVGFAQIGQESGWRDAETASIQFYAGQNLDTIDFKFADAQQKQENQIAAIRNFILQEVDYIVLDPIVETGWESVLEEAKEAGIPVILSDRRAEMEDDSLYTCWVGSDFAEEGRNAGHWLENYLEKQGRSGETVHIVSLQGTLGSSAQIGRTDGFAEVLQQNENWVMLERQSGDFTQAKGQEVMKEFLEKYEDIDVVISENDNMTFGAIEAIREAGRTIGSDGDIIILSFDAVRDALKAIQTGDIAADFECNPLTAPLVEETIRRLEAGESVEKIQYVEETYFDCEMDLSELLESRPY